MLVLASKMLRVLSLVVLASEGALSTEAVDHDGRWKEGVLAPARREMKSVSGMAELGRRGRTVEEDSVGERGVGVRDMVLNSGGRARGGICT